MESFIKKLKGLHFFLIEKEGELILKKSKNNSKSDPYDFKKDKEDIKGFLRKHKEELIDFLQNKKKAKKASNVLYKLSPLQEGMLFQGLYDKESNAYTVQLAIDFISGVDAQVMKSSWEYVFKNHSILRTAFFHKEFSIPVQRVYEDVVLPFRELDYSTYSPSEQAIKLNTFLISDRAAGFTFDEVPLLRITLIKTGEKSYKMVFTNHHILMDGWSLSIVLGEFLQAYEAFYKGEIPPQKITDTYEDYVKYIASKNVEKEEDFWKTYMEGLSAPSLVPFSKTMSSGLGITENYKDELLSFDSDFTSQLVAYARRNHITVNTVVQGAWALLLANYTGNKNVVYGVTVSGRPKTLERAEERVGLYINTLPLHATIEEGKLLSEWLSELQLGHTEAREHQYTNLAKIQHLSGIKGTLFDSLVVFENYPVTEALKKEQRLLKYKNVEANEQTSYLLTLTIGLGTVLDIKFTHNENVLASSDVLLIQGHFRKVLEQFIELSENSKITDVDIVSKKEKERLLEFNTTSVSYPKDKTLLDLIQNQVLQTPYADAVIFEENRLTYKELDERSNQLAHYLIEQGVVTESLVGICLDRSLSMMIGILGILKSGAAYVPIDPDYPEERIHYILQDTASKIVLCDHRSEEILQSIKEEINCLNISDSLLIKEYPTHPTYVKLCPDNLAYVIYTSGSTGKPKGVMNEHRGIVNRLLWTQEHYQLEAEKDIVLQKTTFCFDVSVWELFWPLIAGVPMVFLRPEGHKDIKCLKEAIDSYKVTTLHFVPSMLWIFLLEISRGDCQSLKRVLCSGEALRLDQVNLFREKFPDVRLDNLYGPTEAAIDVTSWQMPKNKQLFKIPIGKPVANTTLYILDKKHRIVPIGVPGDLYIGGVQVARGYLNKELLTKERFIENPFIEGERMYDTGDVARWLVDGNIEYIGRSDQQVKIRGYRIELGEIETILSEQPKILGSCVLAKKDAGGSQQLIGYVVTQGELDKQELQKALKKKLPEYMVPQLWVTLTEIPLTSNGKIDRKSLPDPELSDLSRGVYVAARDEMEEELVGIWQGILNIDKIGVQDDFFDLGGHSLLATRLVSAIRKKMEIALEIKDIFIYPTIESLKIHMFNQGKGTILPALVPQQITTHIPLSFSQERLWFIDQLEGSIPYHIPMILRLTGDLDVHKLIQSLYQIVSRHQALRTVIKSEEGVGYQKIISAENWSMEHEVLDVSKDDISNKLKKFISKPFDLSSDYLFRVCLYELGDNNYILIGVFHHIASDGWSNGILIKEFLELYTSLKENRTTTLLPLPIQYKDYSIWQRTHIEGDVLDKELSYWESKLKKVSPLVLPTDYTRPSIQNTNGADIAISLDVKTRESLKNICKEEGVTMFMGLLSIFKVLLYRYSGQHDICVGTPIANRTQSASEGVIGFFANTLALRSDINHEMSFREVLEQVKRTTLEAYDHQQAPFEKVVDRIIMTRDMSMTPLFQVMFTLQNDTDNEVITLPGLDVSPYPYETSTSSFDLTLTVTETIAGLGLNFTYATALFSKETIQQLAQHYKTLVIEFIGNRNHSVDTVPMLEVSEIERLLKEFNTTKKDYPLDKTVAELFEEQVQKTPDEVAIVFDQDTITYSELDKRANKLANYLNKKEIKKEELVGICMNRSLEMVIGILGVLKSGKAYVPIAPDYPEDRIFYILEDASISLVLSKENEAISFSKKQNVRVILMDKDWNAIAKETIEKPSVQITANHLAYVIYTSGSTGRPKGVMIEHKSVVNFLCAMIEKLHLGRLKSLLSVTTYTFDIFYLELFAPIIQGAKTILLNEESTLDAYKLKEAIAKYSPEFMQATPSTWQMLISSEWNNDENVTVLCGGEAIKEDLKNKLTAVSDTVWNLYGPTEATIWVTAQQLNASEKISIGKPIDNVRASILDRNDALVPIGVVGELCFSGVAIARGYVNKPGLTSERFILDPFISGGRMYRTGDLARWLPDGSLEFLGRKDDQVKIRGYRIELGEIENVLSELEGLDSCCVLSREDGSGVNRLIGYVVSSTDFDKQEAQAFLKHRLPEYMIPQLWVVLEAMPLTSNGKISKKDLPDPDNSGLSVTEYVGYRNKTEEELTSIW
ncbi:amino acid adenylation domain-containing protein, partial [Aquimarina muelleri]|uniref:non-ribosomal peptide synthetase n=3 Tax=Aquimarina muelleri TaxID=279356 RepID=UPI0022499CDB